MTIKELAEVLKVSEKHIRITIKKISPNLLQNGVKTELDEKTVTAIKLHALKNPHLDQSVELPKTSLEKELLIYQAMTFQQEKIKELQQLNNDMVPKALFYDRVANSNDTIDMANVAQTLNLQGIGRNKLYALLRGLKILKNNNTPYQEYVNRGYFKTIEVETPVGIKIKTVVFQKGLEYIIKKIDN